MDSNFPICLKGFSNFKMHVLRFISKMWICYVSSGVNREDIKKKNIFALCICFLFANIFLCKFSTFILDYILPFNILIFSVNFTCFNNLCSFILDNLSLFVSWLPLFLDCLPLFLNCPPLCVIPCIYSKQSNYVP